MSNAPEQIAKDMTPAQIWALDGLKRKRSMSEIGEHMRLRPGARPPMGRYARDRQGLGMVGSLMLTRLEKLGLARRTFDNDNHRGVITDLGVSVLAAIRARGVKP
jgi:DNA-binding MarR family transcriptional regulator